jgi:hypothetical protein
MMLYTYTYTFTSIHIFIKFLYLSMLVWHFVNVFVQEDR